MAIANRGLRFGLNAWVETAAELSRRRALVRNAGGGALNSWCARVDERRQLLNATAALRTASLRRAQHVAKLRARAAFAGGEAACSTCAVAAGGARCGVPSMAWAPLVSERAALRRGTMAIKHRELRMALNGWIEGADERQAALDLMGRAARPVAQRSLRMAMNFPRRVRGARRRSRC